MYREDKITKCEQVKEAGVVKDPLSPFYLFLAPKTDKMRVAIMDGRLIENRADTTIPVVPNEWNPMAFRSVNVTSEVLAEYYVFIGTEG